jgi:hypothetical protein
LLSSIFAISAILDIFAIFAISAIFAMSAIYILEPPDLMWPHRSMKYRGIHVLIAMSKANDDIFDQNLSNTINNIEVSLKM